MNGRVHLQTEYPATTTGYKTARDLIVSLEDTMATTKKESWWFKYQGDHCAQSEVLLDLAGGFRKKWHLSSEGLCGTSPSTPYVGHASRCTRNIGSDTSANGRRQPIARLEDEHEPRSKIEGASSSFPAGLGVQLP